MMNQSSQSQSLDRIIENEKASKFKSWNKSQASARPAAGADLVHAVLG